MIEGPFIVDSGGRRFSVATACSRLGRSLSADIYIPDQRASRCHAEIRWDDEVCYLHDCDSTNGTFLNGSRLQAPAQLHEGDAISIASAHYVFHDPDATLRSFARPLVIWGPDVSEVVVNGRTISLSPKERALLDLLLRNQGAVCSHASIAAAVWPDYQTPASAYQIQSLIKRLREKIELDPRHPTIVLTVRGHGYKLNASG